MPLNGIVRHFLTGKKSSVKNGRLRAEKRGGSMLDMVNREKTPVL
jgi:hypothetical protein